MKETLALTDERLKQIVKEGFDITIEHTEFVPIGESSWLYKASDRSEHQLAIKIV